MTSSGEVVEVTALAITVDIPTAHRWSDTRRDEEFTLTTLTIRLLPDGHLAVKAYGRPTAGGRGNYVSFTVPDDPVLADLVAAAADRAGSMWSSHLGWAEPRRAVAGIGRPTVADDAHGEAGPP